MSNKTLNTVRKIIAEQINYHDPANINLDDALSGLDADSLDAIEIIMAIEGQFGIEIPDEDCERVVTVKDAVELVNRITGN